MIIGLGDFAHEPKGRTPERVRVDLSHQQRRMLDRTISLGSSLDLMRSAGGDEPLTTHFYLWRLINDWRQVAVTQGKNPYTEVELQDTNTGGPVDTKYMPSGGECDTSVAVYVRKSLGGLALSLVTGSPSTRQLAEYTLPAQVPYQFVEATVGTADKK